MALRVIEVLLDKNITDVEDYDKRYRWKKKIHFVTRVSQYYYVYDCRGYFGLSRLTEEIRHKIRPSLIQF